MPHHTPVLLEETMKLLSPMPGDTALDCTLGLGGHSEAILRAVSPSGHLIGLDADSENLSHATKRLQEFSSKTDLLHANFRLLPDCLPRGMRQFDMVLADLGLSSPHVDAEDRGFSFRKDCELDMRFDPSHGMTAAMYLASVDRLTLRDAFTTYGDVPFAHKLTDAIIQRRIATPVRTSFDLVEVAKAVFGHKVVSYLPQIFQALRIVVNDEVGALSHLLKQAPKHLKPGGRFVVISYHSLEDRLVKQEFRSITTDDKDPVTGAVSKRADFELRTRKATVPTAREISENPRARSARLRAIQRNLHYTPPT